MSLKTTIHITRLRAWINRLSLPSLIQLEVLLLMMLICIGAYAFHLIEWWTLLDSLYFTVITVASVGYGDFAPHTDIGKVLAMCYAIVALPIFAYTGALFIERRMSKGKDVRKMQVEMYENFEKALHDLQEIQTHQNLETKQLERLSALEESLVRQINLLRK